MQVLLDSDKNFYKANLHCHSTDSDGKLTKEEIKAEFKKRGYSIVAFTDHEHVLDNSHLDDEDFLAITSCEIAVKEVPTASTLVNQSMKVTHLNFYALDRHNCITPCYSSVYDHFKNPMIEDKIRFTEEYQREYSSKGINEIIETAKKSGFIVSYNHPIWSNENATDYLNYDGLFAVEIYNHSCNVHGINSHSINVFDDMLRAGKRVYCTMCDDCHFGEPLDSPDSDAFGGWVMINAERLQYDVIMNALLKGEFYASTGPTIKSLIRCGEKVIIETSPATQIAYSTGGRRCAALNAKVGETVSRAEFTVDKNDRYFRISVKDKNGNFAYTQGYEVI
ncbi:MAG: hypothetical protein IJ946_04140 [Clostridia bacterium]|nr:hypothetical protein [Clostridia bacterium]